LAIRLVHPDTQTGSPIRLTVWVKDHHGILLTRDGVGTLHEDDDNAFPFPLAANMLVVDTRGVHGVEGPAQFEASTFIRRATEEIGRGENGTVTLNAEDAREWGFIDRVKG
jgi:hypothetical protein